MTKLSLTICQVLCLLLSAGCTSDPKQQTQPPTAARHYCPLVACRLPARPVVLVNDEWRRAIDELEGELMSCAAQVLDCMGRQGAQRAATE
jgi:hypothetical protein